MSILINSKIEGFLNDKAVIEALFKDEGIKLITKFGNPHDFDEETLLELSIPLEPKSKVVQPIITKPYKPRETTIKLISEPVQRMSMFLRSISPYPADNTTTKSIGDKFAVNLKTRDILKDIMPFDYAQLSRMNKETKRNVIDLILKNIRSAIREDRQSLFEKGYMYEDDFEVNKLAYLIKHGDEPVILPEAEFQFIEDSLVNIFLTNIETIFSEAYSKIKGKVNWDEKDGDEIFHFYFDYALKYPHINSGVIDSLAIHYKYISLYDTVFPAEEITNYQLIQHSVLIESLKSSKRELQVRRWSMDLEETTGIHLDTLHSLIGDEGVHYLADDLLYYCELLLNQDHSDKSDFAEAFHKEFKSLYSAQIEQLQVFYSRLFFYNEFIKNNYKL